ncbi:hypothetical protein N9591_01940 [Flavobacteriaceae bacterium]|nr:hypothetical protein [Flavobacteriaceae bacterium]
MKKTFDMDNELKNDLEKLSDKYSNVRYSSGSLNQIFSINGSKNNVLRLYFKTNEFDICYDWGVKKGDKINMSEFIKLKWENRSFFSQSLMRKGDYILNGLKIGSYGRDFKNKVQPIILEIQKYIIPIYVKKLDESEKLYELHQKELEKQRLKELQVSQTNVLSELDKDGNGEVDVVEGNDFNTLLKKHQKSILEVDRNYVQQFVKVSSYLKTKKGNIQSIFNSIKDTPNQEVLNEYVEILKDDIHTYNLILFNSLNMIISLVEDDMITFYEIHEMFDTLNMFDSKHEKDVSQKLTNIGDGLKDLMYEVRSMGNKISKSIQELTYVTEESNRQLKEQLSGINSTMKVGNFINTINTYQNYKTNRKLNS